MSEAVHNAGVERELIAEVSGLFSGDRTPSQDERDRAAKRLRKLLHGNKQLNAAERIGIEGQVWRHFRNGSPERTFLNSIGFLSWN
ncbi:MAG TPA: hypothetical protein VNK73_08535 [Actinomycetota bacterium]|jgi:hypothetical protein|nr:hypothetical protein [Actinomycetota bacterium]